MTKNMTRKGLALGAIAALAVSGLVSTPANAAETLTLAPSAGGGYSTLADSTFTLNVGIPASVTSDAYKYLKYRVQNAAMVSVALDMTKDGSASGDTDAVDYGLTSYAAGASDNDTSTVTDVDSVLQPDAQNAAPAGAQGVVNGITLTAGDPASYDVTAWLDTNNNNAIDAAEEVSPTRTVTFLKTSTVTATVALVAPISGASTLKANVTFANSDINIRQIDSADVLVQFGTYASSSFTPITSYAGNTAGTSDATWTTEVTATDVATSNKNGNDVVWNATDSVFEAVFTPFAVVSGNNADLSVSAATTYAARLFLDNDDSGTTAVSDTQEGTVSTSLTAVAASGLSAKVYATGSANAKTSTVGYEDNGSTAYTAATADDTAAVIEVRNTATASSAVDLNVFIGSDAAIPVPVKNIPVTVVVTADASTTLADAVVVEGKTVYNGQTRTFTKTTGTSGIVTFSVDAGKADADDSLAFVISMNGTAFGSAGDTDATINFDTVAYEIYATDDLASSGAVSIESGDSYSIEYQVLDQWGQAPADNTYRVVASDLASSNSERTTAADFAYNVPVVGGKATVTVKDNGVGTGSYTMRAGFALLDGAAGSSGTDIVDTVVKVVTDNTASKITLATLAYGSAQAVDNNGDGDYTDSGETNNTTKLILETEDLYTYIPNLATPTESAPDLTANLEVTVGGEVTNAAGVAVPYAPVTLQAAGFLFVSGSNYSLDEITLRADASGEFSVNVYSKVGGAQTIRMTSGAATASQALTYAAAVSGAATDFTLTVPGSSEPGKTVDVAVKVVDKFGNPVQSATVTLTSTGPGYLLNTSGTTLKNGMVQTKLLLGSNDSGTAVITATMTIDGEEVTKTTSVVVGVGAVAAADQKVNAGSFKGYVALYAKGYAGQKMTAIVAGKWLKVDSLASNFERVVRYTGAGYDIVTKIYIDGVEKGTFNLTTK